jgi:hypothetical protein
MQYSGLADGDYLFEVRASSNGQTDPTPASYFWVIDTTPPDTYIVISPPLLTNQSSALFTFTSSESPSTFACNLDGGGWIPCASPTSYSSLAAGSHTFQVQATDAAGNTSPTPATYTWTIDITPPSTQITSQPALLTNSTSAAFSFTCIDAYTPCTFQCSMDSGAFTSCTSPATYSGLSEGSHTFQVQATDAAGNTSPTPATYTWTIDITPPDTQITAHPSNPTNQSVANFAFTCTDAHTPCTFECNLDSAGWSPCSPIKTYDAAIWTATSTTNAPAARADQSAVWTGTEMIVWGGWNGSSDFNTGGRYNPATDSWVSTSITNVPVARHGHAAVWTGNEMIVWGGYPAVNTGGRYNPTTDSWTATSTTNAPTGRLVHASAVWTGTEMIVWGGWNLVF